MKFKQLLLYFLSTFLIISCSDDEEMQPSFNHTVKFSMEDVLNPHTLMESPTAHSGKKICHLDSGASFGFGYAFSVPDSLTGKALAIKVDAWVRTGKLENTCDLIVSVTDGKDSLMLWNGLESKAVIKSPNEWTNVVGVIKPPINILARNNLKINVIAHNITAISYFDVDDLIITFSEPNH